jgi:hypothetical protein
LGRHVVAEQGIFQLEILINAELLALHTSALLAVYVPLSEHVVRQHYLNEVLNCDVLNRIRQGENMNTRPRGEENK